jgi:6-phosphogluconate dehydrogenase
MGVSGTGKSTIGRMLASHLNWDFYEGDDFHPQSNIDKMKQGIPLTDEDRAGWLASIANQISQLELQNRNGVVTCSALKEKYRQELTGASSSVQYVFLHGSYDLISERLATRKGHFMTSKLLQSQFETLEEPQDALKFDITESPEKIIERIVATVR